MGYISLHLSHMMKIIRAEIHVRCQTPAPCDPAPIAGSVRWLGVPPPFIALRHLRPSSTPPSLPSSPAPACRDVVDAADWSRLFGPLNAALREDSAILTDAAEDNDTWPDDSSRCKRLDRPALWFCLTGSWLLYLTLSLPEVDALESRLSRVCPDRPCPGLLKGIMSVK